MNGERTLTEWSAEAVRIRHEGKRPIPTEISVIGSVWSVSVQNAVGRSFWIPSSTRLWVKAQ